jgi:hypothetical protein
MNGLEALRAAAEDALALPCVPSQEAQQVAAAGRALAEAWVPDVRLGGGDVYRLSTVAAHLHRLNGQQQPCAVWELKRRTGDRIVSIGDRAFYLAKLFTERHLWELDPDDERAVLDAGRRAEQEGWFVVRSVNSRATTELLAAELADRAHWLRTRDLVACSIVAATAREPGAAAGYTAGGLALARYTAAAWLRMTEAQRATLLVLIEIDLSLFKAIDAALTLGA